MRLTAKSAQARQTLWRIFIFWILCSVYCSRQCVPLSVHQYFLSIEGPISIFMYLTRADAVFKWEEYPKLYLWSFYIFQIIIIIIQNSFELIFIKAFYLKGLLFYVRILLVFFTVATGSFRVYLSGIISVAFLLHNGVHIISWITDRVISQFKVASFAWLIFALSIQLLFKSL